MLLSPFFQAQAISSGAQPSSASANISFRHHQAWSDTNTAAAVNSSAMIQGNTTSQDSTAAPQPTPYCGTFGPPQPAMPASNPSSTAGGGGGSGGIGGGNSYSGDVTTSGPLNFPPPMFAAGRKIKPFAGEGFTLISHVTNRSWKTVKSIRECQFGEVFLAVEVTRPSNAGWGRVSPPPTKYYAIKELSNQKIREMRGRLYEDPLREVSALQYLSSEEHANVLQCTETLRDQEAIYIVTPFLGGELFDVLTGKGQFSEEEARPLFIQVVDALLHLKRHGVCHRDVSLENLLLDDGNRVKLIDFGLALRIPQNSDGSAMVLPPQGACGKQNYISPEVMLNAGGFDGFAVDVWACGILLFVLLTGVPPFELALPSQDQRCHFIAVEERLDDLVSSWNMTLSDSVIELIQSCLVLTPECRPSLESLRDHPWFDA